MCGFPEWFLEDDLVEIPDVALANETRGIGSQCLKVKNANIMGLHLLIFAQTMVAMGLIMKKQEFRLAISQGVALNMVRVVVPFETELLPKPLLVLW